MKLNQTIRNEIWDSVQKAYEEVNPRPQCLKNETGNYFYKKAYGNLTKYFSKIPENFFNRDDRVIINYRGQKHVLKTEQKRPVPRVYYDTDVIDCILTEADSQLDAYLNRVEERKDYNEKLSVFEKECRAVLSQANTLKQLLEMWPDVEPFVPAYVLNPVEAIRLPVIPVSRLNERLGLNKKG